MTSRSPRIGLVIVVVLMLLGSSVTLLTVSAAGLSSVTYTDDASAGITNVVMYGVPVGDWVRVCDQITTTCTGFAKTLGSPAWMGGFNWLPQGMPNGDVMSATNQSGGTASCTMVVQSGKHYCGITPPPAPTTPPPPTTPAPTTPAPTTPAATTPAATTPAATTPAATTPPAQYFNPGDNRVDPRPGDRIAVYCNTPTSITVYGITPNGTGFFLATFAAADFSGAKSTTKGGGNSGTVSAGHDTNDSTYYWIAWNGGSYSATGQGDFAKSVQCALSIPVSTANPVVTKVSPGRSVPVATPVPTTALILCPPVSFNVNGSFSMAKLAIEDAPTPPACNVTKPATGNTAVCNKIGSDNAVLGTDQANQAAAQKALDDANTKVSALQTQLQSQKNQLSTDNNAMQTDLNQARVLALAVQDDKDKLTNARIQVFLAGASFSVAWNIYHADLLWMPHVIDFARFAQSQVDAAKTYYYSKDGAYRYWDQHKNDSFGSYLSFLGAAEEQARSYALYVAARVFYAPAILAGNVAQQALNGDAQFNKDAQRAVNDGNNAQQAAQNTLNSDLATQQATSDEISKLQKAIDSDNANIASLTQQLDAPNKDAASKKSALQAANNAVAQVQGQLTTDQAVCYKSYAVPYNRDTAVSWAKAHIFKDDNGQSTYGYACTKFVAMTLQNGGIQMQSSPVCQNNTYLVEALNPSSDPNAHVPFVFVSVHNAKVQLGDIMLMGYPNSPYVHSGIITQLKGPCPSSPKNPAGPCISSWTVSDDPKHPLYATDNALYSTFPFTAFEVIHINAEGD